MEQNATTAADDAESSAGSSIPTAGQTIVRTLPACAVAVIGIPLVGWFLPPDSADRAPWEVVTVLAALGLMVVVHHFTKAPRPRFDTSVARAQATRAHHSAAKSGWLPSMPGVRIAAGVAACSTIEGFMVMIAVVLGALLGELVRPDFSWLLPVSGALGVLTVFSFRLRRSWSYLQVLHAKARPS